MTKLIIISLAIIFVCAFVQVNVLAQERSFGDGNLVNITKRSPQKNVSSDDDDPNVYFNLKSEIKPLRKPRQVSRKKRQCKHFEDFPKSSLEFLRIINNYGLLVNTGDIKSVPNLPAPFTKVIYREANVNLPLVLRAKLSYSYVPPRPPPQGRREEIPSDVYNYLRLLDQQKNDDAGHLLAYALGGGMHRFNFAPMLDRLNRHTSREYSMWLGEEQKIYSFLNKNKGGYVEWNLYVVYPKNIRNRPINKDDFVRPIGFCLQHTDYDNYNVPTATKLMRFSNDASVHCLYDDVN